MKHIKNGTEDSYLTKNPGAKLSPLSTQNDASPV